MQGGLSMRSRRGEGTVVELRLPLELEDPVEAGAEGPGLLEGQRVLVVDAHPLSRRILVEQLSRQGCLVLAAAEADAALAAAEGQALDAVLIDHRMIDPPGPGLAACLRGRPGAAATAILRVVTATGTPHGAHPPDVSGVLVLPAPARLLAEALAAAIARFRLSLPGGRPLSVVQAHEAASHPSRACQVLLAEDNPVNQRLAVAHLTRLGCEVTVVADGRAAVDAFRGRDYEAVLMDCQMPEVDGYQATRRIRAIEEARGRGRVPIIAVTANDSPEDRQRCVDCGMDQFVPKPLKLAALRLALERCLPVPLERASSSPSSVSAASGLRSRDR
jgi:CheY-like chemotaxis protein